MKKLILISIIGSLGFNLSSLKAEEGDMNNVPYPAYSSMFSYCLNNVNLGTSPKVTKENSDKIASCVQRYHTILALQKKGDFYKKINE